jgi:succinate dehydrogenase / fumarate reductase iron-sulfur subunit
VNITLRVWRQKNADDEGGMVTYQVEEVSPDMSFPVIKDLVVNRGAFDRIIQAGGYISAPTGSAPDAHATPVPKPDADRAFDAATSIAGGACCTNIGECTAVCPVGIPLDTVSQLNRDMLAALRSGRA